MHFRKVALAGSLIMKGVLGFPRWSSNNLQIDVDGGDGRETSSEEVLVLVFLHSIMITSRRVPTVQKHTL